MLYFATHGNTLVNEVGDCSGYTVSILGITEPIHDDNDVIILPWLTIVCPPVTRVGLLR